MAELTPYPFAALVRRMHREMASQEALFDLPTKKFFLGAEGLDFSTPFHGRPAGSPLGPAAGPQTQMAQNLVLSWLGGCRILELKTVQINDELTLPRPCIDMQTLGFNAEWSQELKLEQSLEEYVKGAMLVEMLRSGDLLPEPDRLGPAIWDLSVGYDLEGIQSERVGAFLEGMRGAGETVERLRRQIPAEHRRLRELDYPTRLSGTVTLSTFHGCPPQEIERIIEFLMREHELDCVIKFNPMLLGAEETRHLLHDVLGYEHIRVPDSAFERDATWSQAVEIVERLAETAVSLGRGLGAKFSNTLIVEDHRGFIPASEKEVYLSGTPLHVLAMHLVRRFRRQFGDRFPVSFAAGIDRGNFADAVALGLVPITVCSDLLKPGGYGRLQGYNAELARRMKTAGAATVGDFILRARGEGEAALARLGLGPADPALERCRRALAEGGDLRQAAGAGELYERWVAETKLLNTERYVPAATENPRYGLERNSKPPVKIGSHLELFDCITCDKCIPVCPNDANFAFGDGPVEIPVVKLRRDGGGDGRGWRWVEDGALELKEKHQIGTFADFCNECGNCDVFCPEDGGPYKVKPRFFGREASWREFSTLDGVYLERRGGRDMALGRFGGVELRLEVEGGWLRLSGGDFEVRFDTADPPGTVEAECSGGAGEVDLTHGLILDYLRRAVLDGGRVNPVSALQEAAAEEA
jgi:putative selenate reductase